MKTTLMIFGIGLTICLLGCAAMQNLDMKDVRVEKNVIGSGEFSYSLSEINTFIEKYNYNCNSTARLTFDGTDNKKASYILYNTGLTQANPYLIVDFNEQDGKTSYTSYAIYKTWKHHEQDLIQLISSRGECKK